MHLTLADHNHVSIMAHFDTDEHWLGDQILRFCAEAFGNGGPA
ncbi:hypothetical protein [Diaphorobacter aerolatus]|nr:hypothetical protein [Diaphorobacter aerolatus]